MKIGLFVVVTVFLSVIILPLIIGYANPISFLCAGIGIGILLATVLIGYEWVDLK